jgi:hypothetical protein
MTGESRLPTTVPAPTDDEQQAARDPQRQQHAGLFVMPAHRHPWYQLLVAEEHAMSDAPDNLILVYLRRIDEKLDRVVASVADLGRRMTSLETKVALLHGDFAGQSERIDRMDLRLERIERRLDIVHA